MQILKCMLLLTFGGGLQSEKRKIKPGKPSSSEETEKILSISAKYCIPINSI